MDSLINFNCKDEEEFDLVNDDCCLITGEKINEGDDVEILSCGHKFLYLNIKDWYSQILMNKKHAFNSSFYRDLECPYCRKLSSYLKLREGETPLRYIHKEWKSKPKPKPIKKYLSICNKFKNLPHEFVKTTIATEYTVANLRSICRKEKWKGYSKFKKKDLIKFVYEHIIKDLD